MHRLLSKHLIFRQKPRLYELPGGRRTTRKRGNSRRINKVVGNNGSSKEKPEDGTIFWWGVDSVAESHTSILKRVEYVSRSSNIPMNVLATMGLGDIMITHCWKYQSCQWRSQHRWCRMEPVKGYFQLEPHSHKYSVTVRVNDHSLHTALISSRPCRDMFLDGTIMIIVQQLVTIYRLAYTSSEESAVLSEKITGLCPYCGSCTCVWPH